MDWRVCTAVLKLENLTLIVRTPYGPGPRVSDPIAITKNRSKFQQRCFNESINVFLVLIKKIKNLFLLRKTETIINVVMHYLFIL